MGTAGHTVLEAFYTAILEGKDFDTAVDVARETADGLAIEIPANRANIFDTLFTYYFPNEPYVKEGYEILAVEKKFNLEYDVENSMQYPFVVDLIVKSPEGKTIVVDHKFVYDFYNYEATIMQPQIPKYVGALRALNHKIDHGMYNMIRTRKLKEPDAASMCQQLDVKPESARVTQVFKEQISVASEIQKIKQLEPEQQEATAYRVANKMVCQSCSFLDICRTELSGGNSKLMIETEYKIRERQSFQVSEEVEN
jgi:hypothetical protein